MRWGFAHRAAYSVRRCCAAARSARVLLARGLSSLREIGPDVALLGAAFLGVALSARWCAVMLLHVLRPTMRVWHV